MSGLSRNILFNLLGQLLLLVLGLGAVKHVFRQLGQDALGIIYFPLALSNICAAALDMGITSTTVREVALHFENDLTYIRDLIRTATSVYWGAYLSLACAVFFMAPLIAQRWLHIQALDSPSAIYALRILGIASLSVLPRTLYISLFRGIQHMEVNNAIDVATTAMQQLGTITLLIRGGDLRQVAWWFALCFGFGIFAYFCVAARYFSWGALVPGYAPAAIRKNIRFARSMTFISILSMIHGQCDKLMVSKFLSVGNIGYYGFVSGIVSKAMMLPAAIAQAAFPSFAVSVRDGTPGAMLGTYWKLHDFVCLVMIPIFALLPFIALPLFAYVFNPSVAPTLLIPVALLCLGYYMNSVLNVPYIFSLAAGRPNIAAAFNFLALFIAVPVSALLVRRFGLTGAALSWIFYHILAFSFFIPKVCSECLKIPVLNWYLHFGRISALGAGIYGTAWLCTGFGGERYIGSLAAGYLIATGTFFIAAYAVALPDLKLTIANAARTVLLKRWQAVTVTAAPR